MIAHPSAAAICVLALAGASAGTPVDAAEAAACAPPLTASACYERYLDALQHATHLADLHPFLTSERVQLLMQGLARAREAGVDPAKIERVTLALLKREADGPVAITEERDAQGTSLAVQRTSALIKVRLVLEQGAWRIADEQVTVAR
jgi:hypothetical protein